jgi:L-iditol 2-dehydrogenase
MLARALGAGRIITTDINDYRLKAAREFGADLVIHAGEDIPARVREANGGRLVDLVIICVGIVSVFSDALRCVDRGGTVLFFAPTDPGVELPVPVNDFWRNGIMLLPSYGAAPLDCVQAIELIRSRRVPVAEMITHRLPLEETALGFGLVAEAKECIKVIIEPHKH